MMSHALLAQDSNWSMLQTNKMQWMGGGSLHVLNWRIDVTDREEMHTLFILIWFRQSLSTRTYVTRKGTDSLCNWMFFCQKTRLLQRPCTSRQWRSTCSYTFAATCHTKPPSCSRCGLRYCGAALPSMECGTALVNGVHQLLLADLAAVLAVHLQSSVG